MKHKAPGVTDELLVKAKEEFLIEGYQGASLRKIASAAGVSTNSIYVRFEDKKGLFDAIVKETADEFYSLVTNMNNLAVNEDEKEAAMEKSGQYTFEALDYVYDHFDIFKLIFCKSQGTEYEKYIDMLSREEEKAYKQYMEKMIPDKQVSNLFIHLVCQAGYRYLTETVAYGLTREEARDFMSEVVTYTKAGLEAVIGQ